LKSIEEESVSESVPCFESLNLFYCCCCCGVRTTLEKQLLHVLAVGFVFKKSKSRRSEQKENKQTNKQASHKGLRETERADAQQQQKKNEELCWWSFVQGDYDADDKKDNTIECSVLVYALGILRERVCR